MPYIKSNDRKRFAQWLRKTPVIKTKGELEYLVTALARRFLKDQPEQRYSQIHDTVYAVIHAGEELRRRVMDPYEEEKCHENGDVGAAGRSIFTADQ